MLHKCCLSIANSVLLNFPELKHIDLYLNPVTSVQGQYRGVVTAITVQDPNLVLLAWFVEEHFLPGDLVEILK